MKARSFITLTMAAIATSTLILGNMGNIGQVHAAERQSTNFVCGVSNGVPTTMAQTQRGNVPVIRWTSNNFSDSGWTPERRCQEVSSRFQTYHEDGSLNYLTTGVMNGMPVVCTTNQEGGTCQNLLFTLKEGANAGQTLRDLLQVRTHATGPLNQSEARVYINMQDYLETAALNGEAPTNTTPTPPAASSSPLW